MGKYKKHKKIYELPIDRDNNIFIIILIHSPSLYPQGYAAMRRVFS